ncbi:MAG: glycosyl hydrolase family 28-related protein [Alphaproteobacteria bacterium]
MADRTILLAQNKRHATRGLSVVNPQEFLAYQEDDDNLTYIVDMGAYLDGATIVLVTRTPTGVVISNASNTTTRLTQRLAGYGHVDFRVQTSAGDTEQFRVYIQPRAANPAFFLTAGSGGGITALDGDKGDVIVSSAGSTWTLDPTAVASLNVFTDTLKGITPASGGGTSNFLRADGTWATPPGGGGGGGGPVSDADYGDITVSGTGTVWTIDNNAVTLAKMADMATASLIYRKSAGTGDPEVQTLATLKTDLGLTGTNSGDQTITLTGNVTGSGTGSFATTIAAGAVGLSQMANMATSSLIYRKTAGSGAPEVNTLATLKTDLGLTGTNSGDQTITLTGDVTGSGTGSFVTAIGTGVIVDADVNASAAIAGTKLAFTQTGTGASSRTVDAKLKDGWVSVKDFGATGDGVTNDTTAIDNAIAAVNSAGGGVVYFPPGTYATTTGITLGNGSASAPSTKDNRIRLVGASYGSTTSKINQQVNGASRLLFTGTASLTANLLYFQGPMYGVGVENLTLDCDNKAGRGLLVNHVTQGTFHRVSCRNFTETGFYLTTQSANPTGAAFGCADNRFTDCYALLDTQATNTEGTATGTQTSTTLADTGKTWTTNEWTNYQVRIVSGTGSGQTRTISSNTSTALTVSSAWTTTPVAGSSVYRIEGTIRGIILTSGVSTGTDLAGQPDSARNVFIGGTYFYGCTSDSHGAWLNGADNNAFIEVQFLPRHSVTTGYDVYLQQWTANGAFPLENYFSNLGMTRGVAGNGSVGSSYGNTFYPFPTSDGATGLETVTGISGGDHKGKSYVGGKRAYRGRQVIRVDDSTTRNTTSTTEVDLTGYSTTITTLADTKLKVTLSVWAAKSTTNYGYFYINVGGTSDTVSELRVGADAYYSSRVTVGIIDVGAGTHTVKIRFKSGDGTTIEVLKGFMIVEELY